MTSEKPVRATVSGGRVTIAEALPSDRLAVLTDSGWEVTDASHLDRDGLLESLRSSVAIVVRSATTVDAELLDAAPNLQVIGRAGVGVDNIDIAEATRRGIIVVNAPSANVISAAEHTIGLMLAVCRHTAQAHRSLAEGRWDRSKYTGIELEGKTLGVIGLGRIGREVAHRAQAFGMVVVAHDPYLAANGAPDGVQTMTLDMLARTSDVITLHVAKTAETAGLVNKEFIADMKPGARILNVARGGLIDEAALLAAIDDGHLGGAGIDVFENEPVTESRLFDHPKVVVTPHLGASTREAQDRAARIVAEQVATALTGQIPTYAINLDAVAVPESTRPFLAVGRKLGCLLGSFATSDAPTSIEIELHGDIARYESSGLVLEVQRGVASGLESRDVSLVEAPSILATQKISTTTVSQPDAANHPGALSAKFGERSATMTISQSLGDIRLIEVDGHRISVPVAENLLLIKNENRPGVIAAVAVGLADAGINISDMAVGLTTVGDVAVMAVATDLPVPDDVQARLAESAGLLSLDRICIR